MSVHVTRMLLVIMAVYATGLAAFAFAFHILMPSNVSFYNPATASLKVLVMMIGEFDFEDNFMWRNDEVHLICTLRSSFEEFLNKTCTLQST